ncbi:MAG: glycine betaine ABC transporter substrate-binding protein [Thermovirgaceae bacterium]
MRKFLTVLLAVCFLTMAAGGALAAETIHVGAKNFTEQYVLGHLIVKILENAGYDVDSTMGTGSTVTRKALETGQIDLYPEYTGTAWSLYLKHDSVIKDSEELYQKVKEEDLEKNGIVWLKPSEVNNTYAMAITEDATETMGTSLSELAAYVNENPEEVVFGINQEFYERSDGFFPMAEHYGMEIDRDQVRAMDTGLTFEAMERGQVDVTMVFATDAKIKKYNLFLLEDDKQFFPPYSLSVCIRKDVLDKNPDLAEVLAPMTELTDDVMQELNYRVDVEGLPEEMVVEEYLKEQGII